MNVARTWEADTARQLGIGGAIPFETTRVGKTLHIPCSKGPDGHGHVVDVKVRPNLDPNGTCKQMIHAGWIVGRRRLICPDCRKNKPKPVAPTKRGIAGINALTNYRASLTPEQISELGRKAAVTRWSKTERPAKQKHPGRVAWAKKLNASRTPEQIAAHCAKMRAANAAKKANGKDHNMGNIIDALKPEAPTPSPAAGKARRLIYMALEDDYDEVGKRYKNGKTDALIAKDCGVAESFVKQIREESFGPLGVPDELVTMRIELQRAMGVVVSAAEIAVDAKNKVKAIERKLDALCSKMGWVT